MAGQKPTVAAESRRMRVHDGPEMGNGAQRAIRGDQQITDGCDPQKLESDPVRGSSSNQRVFIVQSTKDWIGTYRIRFSTPMPRRRLRTYGVRAIGNARTQCHVRPPAIVMVDPGAERSAQVRFRYGNEPVQTLSANGPDHPLANSIHLRTVRCRLQHGDPQGSDRPIQLSREDAVAIMK